MASTVFIDRATPIMADWLNDVNEVVYGPSRDCTVQAFGAVGDGVTNDTAAWLEAITYATENSRDLYVPSGKYLVDGNFDLQNIRLIFEGGSDHEAPYNSDGAQIWQTNTSYPIFNIVGSDVTIEGATFYYPDQDGSTASPIAYQPSILFSTTTTCGNINIDRCTWINAYKGIKAVGTVSIAHGRVMVTRSRGFFFDSFIELGMILDVFQISQFQITPGVWQDVAIVGNQYPWKYIADSGHAIRCSGRVDGVWLDNGIIFGYKRGISFESASGATNDWTRVQGVIFDQCSFPIYGASTHGRIADLIVNGSQFYTKHSFDATDICESISINGSADIGDVAITGNQFGYSSGSHITLPTGDSLNHISITGNLFKYWAQATGLATDQYAIFMDAATLDVALGSNVFISNTVYSIGAWFEECSQAAITGNTFRGCRVALRINGPGQYAVTGNVSVSSTIRGFQAADYTRLVNVGNEWDSESITDEGPGGLWPDEDITTRITRLRDRLFVADAAAANGNRTGSQGGKVPTGTEGANWAIRDGQLVSFASQGNMAIVGFTRSEDVDVVENTSSIGVSGFSIGDNATKACWGMYSDVQFEDGTYGYGLEIAVKNKSTDETSTPYFATTGTYGIWLPAGGDSSYGGSPTNPCNTAIAIGSNSSTWNKGIIFFEDGLTRSGGFATAIELAEKHRIVWRTDDNSIGFSIRSDVTTNSSDVAFTAGDNLLTFSGTGGANIAQFAHAASAVNYLQFENRVTGSAPRMLAAGSDTDIDLQFTPKGTGVLRFGAHSTIGAESVTGYITIKDASGTTRKLAVVS